MRQYGGAAKRLHIVVLLTIILLLPSAGKSQEYVRTDFKSKSYVDTMARMVWTGVNMSGQIPVGALRETFKANLSVGTGVTYKTQTNWTFDVNFNYMFGSNLRDTTYSFLGSMINDDGIVCKKKDGSTVDIKCDSVISSAGYIPAPLTEESGKVKLVGDCKKVGNLRSVIWRAYEVAMKI